MTALSDLDRRKAVLPKVRCSTCRTPFVPSRSDARTCSPACRQKAYRRRLSVTQPVTDSVTGNVHFSSATDLWATPRHVFDELDQEFHFETDVGALASNAKCRRFFTPAD